MQKCEDLGAVSGAVILASGCSRWREIAVTMSLLLGVVGITGSTFLAGFLAHLRVQHYYDYNGYQHYYDYDGIRVFMVSRVISGANLLVGGIGEPVKVPHYVI